MIIPATIIITGIILLFIWGSCRLASQADDARDEFWREMLKGKIKTKLGGGMIKKYIAYYAADNETEEFETFDQAKKWLESFHDDARCDEGYSEESCGGEDYIAKITHRSKFTETDNIKNYPIWDEENQEYVNDDGDCWNHSSNIDIEGDLTIEEIKEGKL